jgi:rhodanese-related sulfurtransferase
MKYLLSTIVLFLLFNLSACKGQNNNDGSDVIHHSVDELEGLRAKEKGILLDVRTPNEISQGFIKGAEFLDYYSSSFESSISKYSKEETIYIYCRSGNRSNKAAKIFIKHGFTKVYNMKGGINAWLSSNKKLTKKQ